MSNEKPRPFAIQAQNRKLLEAIWEDLLKLGYEAIPGCTLDDNPSCLHITTNITRLKDTDGVEVFRKLYVGDIGFKPVDYAKVFTLPEDYRSALEFAKEQLDLPYWKRSEYKVGDWVITKGYSEHYDGKALKILDKYDGGYHHFYPSEDLAHNFETEDISRKATYDEVATTLMREARKKYRKGDVVRCIETGERHLLPEAIIFHVSSVYSVFVKDSPVVIYTEKEGWAEIVEQATPTKPTYKVVRDKHFTMIYTWGGEFLGVISNSIIDRMDKIIKDLD